MKLRDILFTVVLSSLSYYCSAQGKIITYDTSKTTVSEKARKYYNDAYDQFDKGNFTKSITLYKLAVAEDPDFLDAYDNLGLAFRQLNMLDSAERYYLISYNKNPNGFTANQNLAVVEEIRNNYEKALRYYTKLTELEHENPEGYYGVSRMYFILKNNKEALKYGLLAEEYYKKIKSPYIGDCYYILCMISLNDKNIPLAKKYLALCKKEGVKVDKELELALEN